VAVENLDQNVGLRAQRFRAIEIAAVKAQFLPLAPFGTAGVLEDDFGLSRKFVSWRAPRSLIVTHGFGREISRRSHIVDLSSTSGSSLR